jgi:SAM-dependent methyltransferase
MNESSKTRRIRGTEFNQRYLDGKSVIDIGCGTDMVVPWATPFDVVDGDANRLDEYFEPGSFDVVYSSHCLEHMSQPHEVLPRWWRLVKPGGVLITVVPDEELYEQGLWPSQFNRDHKWAFTLDAHRLWGNHVIELRNLHLSLPGAQLLDLQKHDAGYRYDIARSTRENLSRENTGRYYAARVWARRLGLGWLGLERRGWPWLARRGIPIDQTSGEAMAQLQIIVRKAA